MNIAEYIEQNIKIIQGSTIKVLYRDFAKEIGLKDICTAKELVEFDLKELFKCRIINSNVSSTIQSSLIKELFLTEQYVIIDFSYWIKRLSCKSDNWLSDILQQTRMNNYIVRGE